MTIRQIEDAHRARFRRFSQHRPHTQKKPSTLAQTRPTARGVTLALSVILWQPKTSHSNHKLPLLRIVLKNKPALLTLVPGEKINLLFTGLFTAVGGM